MKKSDYIVTLEVSTLKESHEQIYEQGLKTSLKKVGIDFKIGANYQEYHSWGNYDFLAIFSTYDINKVINLQNINRPPGTFDLKLTYGTLLYPDKFDITKVSEDYPLIAISYLKIKNTLLAGLREKYANPTEEIIRFIKQRIIGSNNIKFLIVLPFGWEDVKIIFFSTSYFNIKRAIYNIRKTEYFYFPKLNKTQKQRHIITQSCTSFALYLNRSLKNPVKQLEILKKKIINENIVWIINCRVKPGHLDRAIKEIKSRAKNESDFYCTPQAGIYDLAVYPSVSEMRKVNNFIDTYFNIIFHLVRKKDSPLTTTYTVFGFELQKNELEDIKSGKNILEQNEKCEPKLKRQLSDIYSFPKLQELSPHTETAIINTFKTVFNYSTNEMIGDSLSPLSASNSILNDFLNEISKKKNYPFFRHIESLDTWLVETELCFTDRYRGVLPVAEKAVMPSTAYNGSFQRYLLVLDSLSSWICNYCIKVLNENYVGGIRSQSRIPPSRILLVIVNPQSPYTYPLYDLPVTYIGFSVQSLLNPRQWLSVYHEIGHYLFYRYLYTIDPNIAESFREVQYRFMREIIADLFAISCGFNGNVDNYFSNFCDYAMESSSFSLEIIERWVFCHYLKTNNLQRATNILPKPIRQIANTMTAELKEFEKQIKTVLSYQFISYFIHFCINIPSHIKSARSDADYGQLIQEICKLNKYICLKDDSEINLENFHKDLYNFFLTSILYYTK